MRRPLVPPPNRPNPTDPGDAADLSIPQGYQCDRRCLLPPALQTAPGQESPSTAQGNVAHLPRKSTNYVVDNEENLVNLNDQGLTGISASAGFEPKMHVAGPRRVSVRLTRESGGWFR